MTPAPRPCSSRPRVPGTPAFPGLNAWVLAAVGASVVMWAGIILLAWVL